LSTPDRSTLFAVQTPQAFSRVLYEKAAETFDGDFATLTDDSMLFEAAGYRVKLVEGEYTNLKITTDSDVAIAESYIEGEGK
jgi:2-C-methyl-D-erythritol 4-phosphate cytidylyltransferase